MKETCVLCGGEIYLNYRNDYGHGDCTHESWIECRNCGTKFATQSSWGYFYDSDASSTWHRYHQLEKKGKKVGKSR
jgi:hypothetical protein